MERLPNELLVEIFKYTSIGDIPTIRGVNDHWRSVSETHQYKIDQAVVKIQRWWRRVCSCTSGFCKTLIEALNSMGSQNTPVFVRQYDYEPTNQKILSSEINGSVSLRNGKYPIARNADAMTKIFIPDFKGKEKCSLHLVCNTQECVYAKWPLVGNIFTFSAPFYFLLTSYMLMFVKIVGPDDIERPNVIFVRYIFHDTKYRKDLCCVPGMRLPTVIGVHCFTYEHGMLRKLYQDADVVRTVHNKEGKLLKFVKDPNKTWGTKLVLF